MNLETVRTLIEKEGVHSIDLKYADLVGNWYHITFPARRLDHVLHNGIPFDGSSIPGMKSVEAGDMVLLPVFEAKDRLEAQGRRVRIVAVANPRRLFRPGDVAWSHSAEPDGSFMDDAAFKALTLVAPLKRGTVVERDGTLYVD